METVISINKLFKQYSYVKDAARYETLRDSISSIFSSRKKKEHFWALRDINYEIKTGERIGIIGHNGAGKSTLLKILSRITPPTKGEVIIEGRVASLLEVGTGFHPELSGIENIYLNGAILGLRKSEIDSRLDSIIDFSGIETFINTQIKFYSSGMQLRLAFSIAAHLEADILLIDEILAVGDFEFQQKCISRMQELNQSENKTIVFVSHDLNAIANLTENTILLNNGVMEASGPTKNVINSYISKYLNETSTSFKKYTDQPYFENIQIKTSAEERVHYFGDKMVIKVSLYLPIAVNSLEFSFQIINEEKAEPIVYNWFSTSKELAQLINKKGLFMLVIDLPSLHLYKGNYFFKFYLSDPRSKEVYQTLDHLQPFHVQMYGITNEWGWQENVCKYIEDVKLNIESYEPLP